MTLSRGTGDALTHHVLYKATETKPRSESGPGTSKILHRDPTKAESTMLETGRKVKTTMSQSVKTEPFIRRSSDEFFYVSLFFRKEERDIICFSRQV